jgi:hypothetical protein
MQSELQTALLNKKFWEELTTNFPLIQHGLHRKQCLQQFFIAAGTCLQSHCLTIIGEYTDKPREDEDCINLLSFLHNNDSNLKKKKKQKNKYNFPGHAIAQAVSCWLPTIRSGHVGFVVDTTLLGQVFSEYFGFLCQFSFHQLLHIH